MGVAVPVPRRRPAARPRWRSPRIRRSRTGSCSRARRPASASKCARGWGFRPWRRRRRSSSRRRGRRRVGTADLRDEAASTTPARSRRARPTARTARASRANGTLVDLFDTRQFIWPNAIENPCERVQRRFALDVRAGVLRLGRSARDHPELKASALQRTRYRDLSPVGQCAELAFVDRLEQDHFEDGRWASPLTGTPRIEVFSPNYCVHNETRDRRRAALGLQPVHDAVCKNQPRCCGRRGGARLGRAVRRRGAGYGAARRAGPLAARQGLAANVAHRRQVDYPKYLLGPGGRGRARRRRQRVGLVGDDLRVGLRSRVAGRGGRASRSTAARRASSGGTLLGEIRADQPLAAPLAREVSAACDGPGRNSARHGFSFALPAEPSGNVFVYALDARRLTGRPRRRRCCATASCTSRAARTASTWRARRCPRPAAPAPRTSATTARTATVAARPGPTRARRLPRAARPATARRRVNDRSFAAVTTGWIEAPATGTYTFEASQQPSRLFINGTKVLDWFEISPGTTSGTIDLTAGTKYHLRWDRFQAEPPSGSPGRG